MAERKRRSKLLRTLKRALLVLVGLFLLAYLLRGPLFGPTIIELIEDTARESLGMELKVGSLSGSWLGSIELGQVQTEREGTRTPLERLDARRIRAEYSLFGLLTGADDWLQLVELEEARVILDLEQGEPSNQPPGPPSPPPAWLPIARVRGLDLEVRGPDLHLKLPELEVDLSPGEGRWEKTLALRARRAALDLGFNSWQEVELDLTLHYDAGLVQLDSIRVNGDERVEEGRFDLRGLAEDRLKLKTQVHAFQGEVNLVLELEQDTLQGRCQLVEIDSQVLSQFFLQATLPGALNLASEFRVPLDAPLGLEGQLTLELAGSEWEGVAVDSMDLRATAAEGRAALDYLDFFGAGAVVQTRELSFPLDFERTPMALLKETRGGIRVQVPDAAELLARLGITLQLGSQPLPPALALDLETRVDGNTFHVDEGRLTQECGELILRGAYANFPADSGGAALPTAASLHLPLEFRLAEPEALALTASLPSAAGSLTADVEWKGSPDRPDEWESLIVALRSLQVAEGDGRWTMQAGGDWRNGGFDGEVTVAGRDLDAAWKSLKLEGAPPVSGGPVELTLQAAGSLDQAQIDLQWSGQALETGAGIPTLAAPLSVNLHAHYENGSLELYEGRFTGEGLDLSATGALEVALSPREVMAGVLPDWSGPARGEVVARVGALERWLPPEAGVALRAGAATARVALEGSLAAPRFDGALQLAGVILKPNEQSESETRIDGLDLAFNGALPGSGEGFEVELRELAGRAQGEPLELQEPARIRYEDPGNWQVEQLAVSALQGLVRLDGRAALAGGSLQGDVSLEGRGLRFEGEAPLDVDLRVRQEASVLQVEAMQASTQGAQLSLTGSLPLEPLAPDPFRAGAVALSGSFEADVPGLTSGFLPSLPLDAGSASGSLELSGSWKEPDLRVSLNAADVSAAESVNPILAKLAFVARADLRFAEGLLEISALEAESPQLRVAAQGSWRPGATLEELFAGAQPDPEEPVDGQLEFEAEDLAWLAELAPGIRRAGGGMSLAVGVAGPPGDLRLDGRAEIHGASLRLEDPTLSPLDQLEGSIVFRGTEIEIPELSGALGGAPFSIRGNLGLDPKAPIDLTLNGKDLLLYRRQGVKLRADTDLRVGGSLEALTVGGTLALTDARIVKNFDFMELLEKGGPSVAAPKGIQLFSLPDPPLSEMRFDLAIVSPESGLRLRNNVVDGMVRPDLRLRGTGEVPLLQGRVYIDRTEVALPTSVLTIENGLVEFLESDPFVPHVQVNGRTEPLGYKVTVKVTGPYDEPTIFLSSIPPVPQDELFLLVMVGKPPEEDVSATTGKRALGNVAVYLGRDILNRMAGDESTESEVSFLRRFEFDSGRDPTQEGARTYVGSFRVFDDVLTEGDHLYLVGEQDAYQDFNLGIKVLFKF